MEKYAQNNLNIHKKGLFRKNLSIRDMLSWSKDSIRKPMLPLDDKQLKKEACDLFKLVQVSLPFRTLRHFFSLFRLHRSLPSAGRRQRCQAVVSRWSNIHFRSTSGFLSSSFGSVG